jgi:hypothetical protein
MSFDSNDFTLIEENPDAGQKSILWLLWIHDEQ